MKIDAKYGDDEMTLADHAEAWAREQGREVPPRDSQEWQKLYEDWHSFAWGLTL